MELRKIQATDLFTMVKLIKKIGINEILNTIDINEIKMSLEKLKDKNTDKDMLISLRRALQKIKDREKDILVSRFIVGKTQMEIAESLGISQAQVSRIEKSAIENVRKLIK